MKTKTRLTSAAAIGLAAVFQAAPAVADQEAVLVEVAAADQEQAGEADAKVQLAILLDTSGSMSGLIEQAKTQLWQIVNTFISAKQNGRTPYVEVALYEYGNDGLNPENHWIRQIQPLTRDLDQLSEDLFALRTNGGSEFCGAVIRRAVADLDWDPSPDTYKAVFVAGNEPFTQGPVEPAGACREAIARGVIVNTIHCGTEKEGVDGGWKSGAVLADGTFLIIDHDKAVVHIDAPQDAEIVSLNEELNKTYIPIGAAGAVRYANQAQQDANAEEKADSGALVQRVLTKASLNYVNSNWDLVDACVAKDFDWSEVKQEELPEEMRGLSIAQCKEFADNKRVERQAIQAKIQELNKARDAFVTEERKRIGEAAGDTLDQVVVDTVKKQALEKGYAFED